MLNFKCQAGSPVYKDSDFAFEKYSADYEKYEALYQTYSETYDSRYGMDLVISAACAKATAAGAKAQDSYRAYEACLAAEKSCAKSVA